MTTGTPTTQPFMKVECWSQMKSHRLEICIITMHSDSRSPTGTRAGWGNVIPFITKHDQAIKGLQLPDWDSGGPAKCLKCKSIDSSPENKSP